MPSSVQFHHTRLHQVHPAPSVLAQRNKEYQFARFLFLSYLVAVVAMVSAFGSLLYGGTLLTLWEGLLRLHPSPETWVPLSPWKPSHGIRGKTDASGVQRVLEHPEFSSSVSYMPLY